MNFYDDFQSDEKDFVNENIVAKSIHDSHENNGIIVVLDSVGLRTTRELIFSGIDPARIRIVERLASTRKALKEQLQCLKMRDRVKVLNDDLFVYLEKKASTSPPRKIRAIFADLMQADVSRLNRKKLAQACKLCDVQRLYVTLCGRGKTGLTLKKRIERLHRGKLASVLPGLARVYGYRRDDHSTIMFVIEMTREPCRHTMCRPLKVRYNANGRCLVEWRGFPQREDWTWERSKYIFETSGNNDGKKVLRRFAKRHENNKSLESDAQGHQQQQKQNQQQKKNRQKSVENQKSKVRASQCARTDKRSVTAIHRFKPY